MDHIIAGFTAARDRDLMLCIEDGVAYQRNMATSVPYDDAYFDKYVAYEGHEIARKLNAGRVDFVSRHVGSASLLDIGVGSGEFIKARGGRTWGFDVNPKARNWLLSEGLWAEVSPYFEAFTFWDVLEHVKEPHSYFSQMAVGAHAFVAMPIFADLTRVRESKHYRPNEHYYYFTEPGLVRWMEKHGFNCIDASDHETAAGRESIGAFAFRLDRMFDESRIA